jgi:hypothetical protein
MKYSMETQTAARKLHIIPVSPIIFFSLNFFLNNELNRDIIFDGERGERKEE